MNSWEYHRLPPATPEEMRAAYEATSERAPVGCRLILAHSRLETQGKRAYCPDIWRAVQAGQASGLPLFDAMDATELLYEARQLAVRVSPHRRDAARAQVERAEAELEAFEARLRELIGKLERWADHHGGER